MDILSLHLIAIEWRTPQSAVRGIEAVHGSIVDYSAGDCRKTCGLFPFIRKSATWLQYSGESTFFQYPHEAMGWPGKGAKSGGRKPCGAILL
jgi:hypothetical protein